MAAYPRVMSLCSGYGGLDLAVRLVFSGARTVLYCEREVSCARILAARMEDGQLDPAPIWSDVATLDARPWAGAVDLIVAGFPCQPHSLAGARKGTADHRWPVWDDIISIAAPVQLQLFSSKTSPDYSPAPEASLSPVCAPIWTMQAIRFKPPALWVLAMSGHLTKETVFSSWPTPRVTTNGGNGKPLRAGKSRLEDDVTAWRWPTPTVNGNHNVKGMSPTSGDGLATSIKQWPTPASRDWRDGRSHLIGTNARPLNEVATAFSHPDLTPTGQPLIQDSGQRQLNPRFVEWMMGLPDGWTSLAPVAFEPSAMALYHCRQR